MMNLAMNFDTDECLVTAMFDKGNRNDTMEAIDNIIPFLKGDADMIGLVCNTIRKLFSSMKYGYGSSVAIMIVIICMVVGMLFRKFTGGGDDE